MSYHRYLILGIFLLNILILFKNHKIFKSYVQQSSLLADINGSKYDYKDSYDKIDLSFPEFSVTSMNLKAIKSRYLINEKKHDRALKLLDSIKYDPLQMKPRLKAEIFLYKQKEDSLLYYSKKAFEGLPLNSAHAIFYFKALRDQNKIEEVIKIYSKYESEINDLRWAYFYFATAYPHINKFPEIVIQAEKALVKYKNKNNENLKTILYYIIYGEDNYKQSLSSFNKGNDLFSQNQFESASVEFNKARKLFPLNFDFYYNEMVCNYYLNQVNEVLSTYNEIKNDINPKNGKPEFLIAKTYLNLNDTLNSCKYFTKSENLGFRSSKAYLINICNN